MDSNSMMGLLTAKMAVPSMIVELVRFHFDPELGKKKVVLYHDPEKAMAPHSSALAWKIPWVEEPGGLLSMGSHRVGHD